MLSGARQCELAGIVYMKELDVAGVLDRCLRGCFCCRIVIFASVTASGK
jgi:hypothetical protein